MTAAMIAAAQAVSEGLAPPRFAPVDRAQVSEIRAELGLDAEVMARRIGISRNHYLDLEAGNSLVSPMLSNAIRWVEFTRGQLTADICEACDGVGRTPAPPSPSPTAKRAPGALCEACDGQGVARVRVSADVAS